MKKLSIIGSALGASLLQILARGGSASRTTRKEQRARQHYLYQPTPDVPTDARHWHNPADSHQAARIEAAAAKRERRGEKLMSDTQASVWNNPARCWIQKVGADGKVRSVPPRNLQSFYVPK